MTRLIRVHTPDLAVSEVPLPDFLIGLDQVSLASLMWTDKNLGVRDYGWWPVDELAAPMFDPITQGIIGYTYQASDATKRVTATPVIGSLPAAVIAANQAAARDEAKDLRAANVERIKVTTKAGRVFDGDEVSQGRMARAILAMETVGRETTPWILADNTPVLVSSAELREALVLAGEAQTAVWVI